MISVYFTCRDNREAERIGKSLVEKKLAACVNIFPITSMFFWDKKLRKQPEVALLAKTREEKFYGLQREVKRMHSYKVPCIVAFPWKNAAPGFAEWVRKETP